MNQDEIIEMARQAGAAVGKPTPDGPNIVFTQCLDIYAFAKLVAAKEREALVLLLRNLADDHTPNDCADMIVALQSLGTIRARGEA